MTNKNTSIASQIDAILESFEDDVLAGSRPDFQEYLTRIEASSQAELMETLVRSHVDLRINQLDQVDFDSTDYQDLGDEAVAIATEQKQASIRRKLPKRIGPYQIKDLLGVGGFGNVYEGYHTGDFNKTFAIKLIRRGKGSDAVIARFKREQKALARMNHPNIVGISTSGTENEMPFFVMELVEDGKPITTYCDQKRLTIEARLQLFMKVCDAIKHAHQKLVIHRDLKPSNVLVTEVDGVPQPKVIDFGLAKAMETPLDNLLVTQQRDIIGTPQYMSPEQALGKIDEIDVRADVYALGVILFELLTGSTPMDEDTVARIKRSPFEISSAFERPVPKPSSRVEPTDGISKRIAEQRQMSPNQLNVKLENELDWIVLGALAQEPARRYQSVSDLCDDVRRHLNNEPIIRKPPSKVYYLRKFVQRNRGLVTSLAVISLLLVGLAALTGYGLVREHDRAEVERLAKEGEKAAKVEAIKSAKRSSDSLDIFFDSFRSVDPKQGADSKMTATDVLFEAKKKLDESNLDAEGKAVFLRALVPTLASAGEIKASVEAAKDEMDLRKIAFGEHDPGFIAAMIDFAQGQRKLGHFDTAIDKGMEAVKLSEEYLDSSHPHRLGSLTCVAAAYFYNGDIREAIKIEERVLAVTTDQKGKDSSEAARAMGSLASSYFQVGRIKDAVALEEKVYEIMKLNLGPDHPSTLISMNNLAGSYHHLGRLDHAMALLEPAFRMQKKKLLRSHPHTLATMRSMVACYNDAGRAEEALKINRQLIAALTEKFSADHHETIISEGNLAISLAKLGDIQGAISKHEYVVEKLATVLSPVHPEALIAKGYLADEYRQNGELEKALETNSELLNEMLSSSFALLASYPASVAK